MNAPVIAFFNNKGGVGTTSLVYHLAWMVAQMGLRVVAADLDPQANLTANFLDEDELERLWPLGKSLTDPGDTIYGSLVPLIRGVDDIGDPVIVDITDRISLLPGDLSLSKFDDELSSQWTECLDGKERAFRVISAFWRLLDRAARQAEGDVVLMDVGPNLGAINRSALIAADYVVITLAPDLLNMQGLQNLGPTLRNWRAQWKERLPKNPDAGLGLPVGRMAPAGYVVLDHGVRTGRSVTASQRWMERIPGVYRKAVLAVGESEPTVDEDRYCLAQLKQYRSLMPMSYESRKPVFALKPADGAFGGHQAAVSAAGFDFAALSRRILKEARLTVPVGQSWRGAA